jgi:hypothetical protein
MATGNRRLAGTRLCGAVHYTVADEFLYAAWFTISDDLPQHSGLP